MVVLDLVVGVVEVDDLLDFPARGADGCKLVVHHINEETVELRPLADLPIVFVSLLAVVLLLDLVLDDVPDDLLGVLHWPPLLPQPGP